MSGSDPLSTGPVLVTETPRGTTWLDPYGRPRLGLVDLAGRCVSGRVSVIMPVFNAASYLAQAIESVLSQDHSDVQLVVVDDSSTDDSVAIASGYGTALTLIERSSHGGACAARNDGLGLATGARIMFLDSDDYLLPGAVSGLVARARPGVTVFGERLELSSRGLRATPSSGSRGWGRMEPLVFMLRKGISDMVSLHQRSGLYEIGGFDESLPQAQEKDLHIRLVMHGVRFDATGVMVGVQRVHESASRITNCVWAESDPWRHYDLSMHWLTLVRAHENVSEDSKYDQITGDRIVEAARRALDSGYPTVANQYVVALAVSLRDYRFSPMSRLLGGPDTSLGRRVILGDSAAQRIVGRLRSGARFVVLQMQGRIRGRRYGDS